MRLDRGDVRSGLLERSEAEETFSTTRLRRSRVEVSLFVDGVLVFSSTSTHLSLDSLRPQFLVGEI